MSVPTGWATSQGTLARALTIDGHGLHTGRRVGCGSCPRVPRTA